MGLIVATADLENNPTTKIRTERTDLTKDTKENSIKFGDTIVVHYSHERRFQSFQREIDQVYDKLFENTAAMNVKMIVGNKNRSDAKKELIHKRPKQSLLINQIRKSKFVLLMQIHTTCIKCIVVSSISSV